MKIAVFAGSFDPFTLGHLDIVQQALNIFDRIIIGVGVSGSKTPLLEANDRVDLIRQLFSSEDKVEVENFEGLVVDFAKKKKADCLLRGLRTEADFSYEMPMAMTNHKIAPEIQTVFLPTKSQFAYVSSSLVKELFFHGGDISSFVPQTVIERLNAIPNA